MMFDPKEELSEKSAESAAHTSREPEESAALGRVVWADALFDEQGRPVERPASPAAPEASFQAGVQGSMRGPAPLPPLDPELPNVFASRLESEVEVDVDTSAFASPSSDSPAPAPSSPEASPEATAAAAPPLAEPLPEMSPLAGPEASPFAAADGPAFTADELAGFGPEVPVYALPADPPEEVVDGLDAAEIFRSAARALAEEAATAHAVSADLLLPDAPSPSPFETPGASFSDSAFAESPPEPVGAAAEAAGSAEPPALVEAAGFAGAPAAIEAAGFAEAPVAVEAGPPSLERAQRLGEASSAGLSMIDPPASADLVISTPSSDVAPSAEPPAVAVADLGAALSSPVSISAVPEGHAAGSRFQEADSEANTLVGDVPTAGDEPRRTTVLAKLALISGRDGSGPSSPASPPFDGITVERFRQGPPPLPKRGASTRGGRAREDAVAGTPSGEPVPVAAAPAEARPIDLRSADADPAVPTDEPSDLVDPEPIESAFHVLFQGDSSAPAVATIAPDESPVLSRTTGDLVYAPPPGQGLRGESARGAQSSARVAPVRERRGVPLPPKGDIVIGIDLGTTYSCAAIVEAGKAHVLASRWGTTTIPSAVAYMPDGRTLVGESALRYGTDPRRTIIGAKRLFGRPFHSAVVQQVRDHYAYDIVEGDDGEAAVLVDGRKIGLEEIAAVILREIRESATLQLDGRVNRAVITCPAHFNERQRDAVRAAGELAGFHVERVLSEPTAAALNFGLGRSVQKKKVLVYDLGGGTFDVSLLEVNGDVYEVLATGGDTFLGGLDFDACIADLVVEAFLEKEGIDARTDAVAIARILQFAERAKRELTDRSSTIVQIDHLVVQPHAPRALTVPIRRSRVEELWAPLVEHTAVLVKQVLERANVKTDEVGEVILAGGQSRTPLVQRRMEALFGRPLPRVVNPDEAIALGAAQYAASLSAAPGSITLIDVLPTSIGVGLPGGRYKKIIERDTKLPTERTYSLRSTRDNQTRFEIMLFQGEDESVENDDPLGVLVLEDLPKGPKGSVSVVVTLKLTSDCVLEVLAREAQGGRTVSTKLATRQTSDEIRKKLGLPSMPPKGRAAKPTTGRPKGVWGWLTSLFRNG